LVEKPLMGWEIAAGPEELRSDGKGIRWRWSLYDPDEAETKALSIDVNEDALASRVVSDETARAIVSQGQSAIAEVIDWPVPPDHIEISDDGIVRRGGTRPEDGDPLSRIKKWFAERDIVVEFEKVDS